MRRYAGGSTKNAFAYGADTMINFAANSMGKPATGNVQNLKQSRKNDKNRKRKATGGDP